MRDMLLKNLKLTQMLTSLTDQYFSDKYDSFLNRIDIRNDNLITDFHACSEDYLKEAFKHNIEEFGYPRSCHGLNRIELEKMNYDLYEEINKNIQKVGSYLGTPLNALSMCYPDNGFIGWHHNGNAPGYNILLTYSQDGDGNFSYWDYDSKSIVKLQDKPGWNLRVGYYPSQINERDKLFWHMAETKRKRITFAWIIYHKEMWKSAIDELTCGEFNTSTL